MSELKWHLWLYAMQCNSVSRTVKIHISAYASIISNRMIFARIFVKSNSGIVTRSPAYSIDDFLAKKDEEIAIQFRKVFNRIALFC